MSLSIRKQKKRLYRNRSKFIVVHYISVQRYSVDQKQWVYEKVKLNKAVVSPKQKGKLCKTNF